MSPLRRLACLTLVAAILIPASAQGNVPMPSSVVNAIRIPAAKNLAIGTLTFTATFSDSQATLTATSPTVMLGPNAVMKVMTCVMAHPLAGLPTTTCAEKTYDTHGNIGSIAYGVPSVTRTIARPKAGASAYATAQSLVYVRQANGSWGDAAAGSWPATGLSGAGIAIPPVGAASATLPTSQGLSSVGQGGVNTGYADSMCTPTTSSATGPTPSGLSTTALGAMNAPYEVGEPSDGRTPMGIMIVLHGGAWVGNGAGALEGERPTADRWRARGWRTVNSSYRACASSVGDALAVYDRVRAVYGSAVPVCLSGSSAGANLALLVAAQRSGVYCVIARGAPTDLTALSSETAYPGADTPPKWLQNMATAAFGFENLRLASPALLGVRARVLLATAANDPLIPAAQAELMRDRMLADDPNAYADVDLLAGGDVPWVHASVSQAAEDDYEAREQALVAPLG